MATNIDGELYLAIWQSSVRFPQCQTFCVQILYLYSYATAAFVGMYVLHHLTFLFGGKIANIWTASISILYVPMNENTQAQRCYPKRNALS